MHLWYTTPSSEFNEAGMKGVFAVAVLLSLLFILGFFTPRSDPQLVIDPLVEINSSNGIADSITYSDIYSNGIVVCTPQTELYKFQLFVWNRENYTIPLSLDNAEYLVRGIDGIFNTSAKNNGGKSRHILFDVDSQCTPIVRQVFYTPTNNLYNDIWEITTKLWSSTTRPIVVVSNMQEACGLTWVYTDSQKDITKNSMYLLPVGSFVSASCIAAPVFAHEIVHALGGIQFDAPNSDHTFHCLDNYDLMCIKNNNIVPCSPLEFNILLDCDNNDYFSVQSFESFNNQTIPLPYLATHLNIADSPFLEGDKYIKKYFFPMVE